MHRSHLIVALTLGAAGGHRLRGAAPDGRELRIFLNERVAGPRGQRDGVGPDNKTRARGGARGSTCGPRRKNRDASRSRTPRTTSIIMTTTFRYEDTVEDAREAFIFFVVVACFVCCCCGSCAARRLARRNYPHGRELRRPLLDDTDAEVALGSSGEDWPCPVCRHANPPSRSCCDVAAYRARTRCRERTRTKTRLGGRTGWRRRRSPPRLLSRTSSRSTDEEEAPIRLTPLQKRAARRHRWRRAVEDDGIVWRGDDSSPASVVLELREDNAVIVEAAGATADLVGEGSPGHGTRVKQSPRTGTGVAVTVSREVPLVRAGIRFYKKRAGRRLCALDVRRDRLEDSVQQLLALEPKHLRRWMRVQFSDEPGIDVGGLEREWFSLACGAILDQDVGVFAGASDGGLKFDPSASLPPDLGGHPRSRSSTSSSGGSSARRCSERVFRCSVGLAHLRPIIRQSSGI